ncbi:YoaH family protein [Actinobacillus genomosp. 2]|uniref:YoaH family protein n=1 Tax=Actinobacillus genomosp. 2 TaxID=230709 RepID=UPI0024425FBE|nr:YoaH family protein [Actinobacillus genomosp. 2]WGE32614.1 YoaH family protein [Actinobacillus genomosp. 2]
MDNALLSLTHEQQQAAVEQIQELMAQGVSSGEAIQIIANRLREAYQSKTED